MTTQICPCGTEKTYMDCCGKFISGKQLPTTPEELMRSRYTAYTENNLDYIEDTMKPPAANRFDRNAKEARADNIKWLGLEVLNSSRVDDKGHVEFMAYYLLDAKKQVLHERSEFQRDKGKWFYVDGVHTEKNLPTAEKVGRNDLCPCGSGKKYKKCCVAS